MTLISVDHRYVARFEKQAAKEGVSLKATVTPVEWFRTLDDEGFAGVMQYAPGKWRIKGVFVHPEERGRGVGGAMTDELITYLSSARGAKRIEVIAMNPKFYEARGFMRETEIRPGSWRLARGW